MKQRILILLLALCVGLGYWYTVGNSRSAVSRLNVVLATAPVTVWSWNTIDNTFAVLVIPAFVAVDAPGYGRYALESLWRLGFIDKKGGSALSKSLESALAIPISRYAGEDRENLVSLSDPGSYGRRFFGLIRFPAAILTGGPTNMPLPSAVSFAWALWRAKADDVTVVDIGKQSPVGREELPDGSVRQYLDTERVDVLLKGALEDDRIRNEGLRVAVYNTTKTPNVGTAAARFLVNQGVLVVAVGNDEPQVDRCTMVTEKKLVKTTTVKVIAELFDCVVSESSGDQRADILVRLGTAYAARFGQEGT